MVIGIVLFFIFLLVFSIVEKEGIAFVLVASSGITLGMAMRDIYLKGNPVLIVLISVVALIFIGFVWMKRKKFG